MDRSKGGLGASLRLRRVILGPIECSLKGTITLDADSLHSAHFLPFCDACQANDELFEAALADALDMATAAISVSISADTPIIGEGARYFPLNTDPE